MKRADAVLNQSISFQVAYPLVLPLTIMMSTLRTC
ncbi:hypothetical protein T03_1410 [Trichinella britovi]|uniref:Uncharacterized protein n=1 Tax=Trichinella britovi TaxID=45882 RepID=A0A0V0ZET6_TRIBR|nr:hypothetical protein T09_11055 [Trichinella sp. T9]KRY11029.1 hypothetical protein T03_1410 [Trichinella britovi]